VRKSPRESFTHPNYAIMSHNLGKITLVLAIGALVLPSCSDEDVGRPSATNASTPTVVTAPVKQDQEVTDIFNAVKSGDEFKFRAALKANPKLANAIWKGDPQTLDSCPLILIAAENGRRSMVLALLKSGADINAKNDEGETSLHLAVRRGDSGMVELLIANHADVNAKTETGLTPLKVAAPGMIQVTEPLRKHGATE
jgi:ankyrin repeat protein